MRVVVLHLHKKRKKLLEKAAEIIRNVNVMREVLHTYAVEAV